MRARFAMVAWLLGAACGPDQEIFADGACVVDADCGTSALCVNAACVSCQWLYDQCEAACPGAWTYSEQVLNQCPLCGCSTGTAGSAGMPAIGGSAVGGSGALLSTGGTTVGGTAGGGSSTGTGATMASGGTAGTSGCLAHTDCPLGQRCDATVCTDCATTGPVCPLCHAGETPMILERNGCQVCDCARPSACQTDADCGTGLTCYPGTNCDDGCRSPACCVGNACGATGCPDPDDLACGIFGCANGGACLADCLPAVCTCDTVLAAWSCTPACPSAGQCSR